MTTQGSPGRGEPREKLRRAREHLVRLHREIESFVGSKPYRLAVQSDVKARLPRAAEHFQVVCVHVDPIPADIPLTMGDSLTNARAALDHLAWDLVLDNGGQPDEYTSFPILGSPPRKRGSGEPADLRISGGPSRYAMSMVEAAQPYSGPDGIDPANHPLWILDRLVGIDKHRHPLLCVQTMDALTVAGDPLPPSAYRRKLEVGARVAGFHFDQRTKVDVDLDLTTAVEVVEGEPGSGQPLGDLCESLLDAVGGTIDEFLTASP